MSQKLRAWLTALVAILALLLMVASPVSMRVVATIIGVELALLLTGYVSAKLGGADPGRAIVRNMLVASLAMTTTYLLGTVFAG